MNVYGIDPGTQTGIALWSVLRRELVEVHTMTLLEALFMLRDRIASGHEWKPDLVLFEDARKQRIAGGRTFGQVNRLQGVGSVKRDSALWQEFCDLTATPWVAAPPIRGATKLTPQAFAGITGWQGRTSHHARDAAMRVYGLNAAQVRAMIHEGRQRWLDARTRPNQRLQDAARGRA